MYQTKKENQRYFGLKVHVEVDAKRGLVCCFTITLSNEHDLNYFPNLMHGEELFVSADLDCCGAEKCEENKGKKGGSYRGAKQNTRMEEAP